MSREIMLLARVRVSSKGDARAREEEIIRANRIERVVEWVALIGLFEKVYFGVTEYCDVYVLPLRK